MSVWNVPLGLNVVDNPIVDSVFIDQEDFGISYPPSPQKSLLTEGGTFIMTEGNIFITTE